MTASYNSQVFSFQTFRATLSNENDGVPSCKNCNRLGRRNIYSITENGFHAPEAENRNSRSCCAVTDPSVVDRVARVIFPLAFFLFNVVYWVVYLTWQPPEHLTVDDKHFDLSSIFLTDILLLWYLLYMNCILGNVRQTCQELLCLMYSKS